MSSIYGKMLPKIEATGIVRNLAFVLLNPEVRHTERQAALKSLTKFAAQGDTAAVVIVEQAKGLDLQERISAPPKRYGKQRAAYEARRAQR
jgi:hypothetical protein